MATLLRELEMLQDRSFAVCGRLMAALIDARIEQNIAPIVGKSIRAGISDVAVQISGAQGATADVHRLLEALAKARGLDVRLYGDTDKQDPRPGFTA
ncbi:hypothetical protein KZ813_15060 [Sphingomonas sp. RHCKR7]|uniref:hypothetical protein n=1 Tax=Sphingomonas folli TaxID=2862497 RepID=UPI001CA5C879|nr:hypothetical protein [Sphingomonas folli]MBW6528161.1 hypothetical protein [Sphingomonas folli]